MLSIADFIDLIKVLLGESVKYFVLILLVVLAIRFWRRLPQLPAAARPANMALASVVTLLALGTGYFSLNHSLSRMYFHFGMNAFRAGRVDSARSLFEASGAYHKNADATGAQGVCLLVTAHTDQGLALLAAARSMRGGRQIPFEDFYAGLYYYYQNQLSNAVPLLQEASSAEEYHWPVIKLFAVVELDQNRPQEALSLMQPYLDAEITEPDQAYVIARLRFLDHKTPEAKVLVDKYASTNLTPFWQRRFQQLQTSIQNENHAP